MTDPAFNGSEEFVQLCRGLGPYLSDVVFIGGWAHRLHRLLADVTVPPHPPLMTLDADVALRRATRTVDATIHERLLDAGFLPKFIRGHEPPTTHYEVGGDSDFYAQFLTPMDGRKYPSTIEVAGVIAERLRYIDLLLRWPVRVRLTPAFGFEVGSEVIQIRIANPTMYLLQKHLALEKRRTPSDRHKDILYIFDSIRLLENRFATMAAEWRFIRTSVHSKWRKRFDEVRHATYAGPTGPVIGAQKIAVASNRPSPPSAEELALTCQEGLLGVFGESS